MSTRKKKEKKEDVNININKGGGPTTIGVAPVVTAPRVSRAPAATAHAPRALRAPTAAQLPHALRVPSAAPRHTSAAPRRVSLAQRRASATTPPLKYGVSLKNASDPFSALSAFNTGVKEENVTQKPTLPKKVEVLKQKTPHSTRKHKSHNTLKLDSAMAILKADIIMEKYNYVKANLYTLIRIYKGEFKTHVKHAMSLNTHTTHTTHMAHESLKPRRAKSLTGRSRKDLSRFDFILDEYFKHDTDHPFILLPFGSELEVQIMKIYVYLYTLENLYDDVYKGIDEDLRKKYDVKDIRVTYNNSVGGGPKKSMKSKTNKTPEELEAAKEEKRKELVKKRKESKAARTDARSKLKESLIFLANVNTLLEEILENYRSNPTLPVNIAKHLGIDAVNMYASMKRGDFTKSNEDQCHEAGLVEDCEKLNLCYLCMVPTPPYSYAHCTNWKDVHKVLWRECEHILYFKLAFLLNALAGLTLTLTELQSRNYGWSHHLCNGPHKSQACFVDWDGTKWVINSRIINSVIIGILSDVEWQNYIWTNPNSQWVKHGWPEDLDKVSVDNVHKLYGALFANITNAVQMVVDILNLPQGAEFIPDRIPQIPIPDYSEWFISSPDGSKKSIKIDELYGMLKISQQQASAQIFIFKGTNTTAEDISKYTKEIDDEYAAFRAIQDRIKAEKAARRAMIAQAKIVADGVIGQLRLVHKAILDIVVPPLGDTVYKSMEGRTPNEKFKKLYLSFKEITLDPIDAFLKQGTALNKTVRLIIDNASELDTKYKEIDKIYDAINAEVSAKKEGIKLSLNKIFAKIISSAVKTDGAVLYIFNEANGTWESIAANSFGPQHIGKKVSIYSDGSYSITVLTKMATSRNKLPSPAPMDVQQALPAQLPSTVPQSPAPMNVQEGLPYGQGQLPPFGFGPPPAFAPAPPAFAFAPSPSMSPTSASASQSPESNSMQEGAGKKKKKKLKPKPKKA